MDGGRSQLKEGGRKDMDREIFIAVESVGPNLQMTSVSMTTLAIR